MSTASWRRFWVLEMRHCSRRSQLHFYLRDWMPNVKLLLPFFFPACFWTLFSIVTVFLMWIVDQGQRIEKQMSGWTSTLSDKWSDWNLPEWWSVLESILWLMIPSDPVPASTFFAPYCLSLCSWIAYIFFHTCPHLSYLTKSVSLSIRLSHCISELKVLLHSLSPVRLGEPEQ